VRVDEDGKASRLDYCVESAGDEEELKRIGSLRFAFEAYPKDDRHVPFTQIRGVVEQDADADKEQRSCVGEEEHVHQRFVLKKEKFFLLGENVFSKF
jgi:hypothetical protein